LAAQQNKAEGDYVIEKRKADSMRYTIDTTTEALANQISAITKVVENDSSLATRFLIEQKKLEHLSNLAKSSKSNNSYFFPEATSLIPNYKISGDLFNMNNNNISSREPTSLVK